MLAREHGRSTPASAATSAMKSRVRAHADRDGAGRSAGRTSRSSQLRSGAAILGIEARR
jgi:hypothetical protein